jgi:hypothetical protein
MYKQKLTESLRRGDLKDYVSDIFTVDRYKSKMGEDQDILVLGFKVKEKYPAIDLMEFIEKGYNFILDADISAGEERDGQYQVFVEIERTPGLTEQLKELVNGISQLCDCYEWKFRYQSTPRYFLFNEDTIKKQIPMTPEGYKSKILEIKNSDVKDFFNQGAVEVTLDESNNLIFKKPFAGDLYAKFVSIGKYKDVEKTLPGAISLDESSQSQVLFLNKYIGNYDIHKIGNKFLIRNGNDAIIIEKDRW